MSSVCKLRSLSLRADRAVSGSEESCRAGMWMLLCAAPSALPSGLLCFLFGLLVEELETMFVFSSFVTRSGAFRAALGDGTPERLDKRDWLAFSASFLVFLGLAPPRVAIFGRPVRHTKKGLALFVWCFSLVTERTPISKDPHRRNPYEAAGGTKMRHRHG